MNRNATDVIIHTCKPLSRSQFEGVISFDRSRTRPNFILVAYNTGQTCALAILNKMTRLGLNASLVGI